MARADALVTFPTRRGWKWVVMGVFVLFATVLGGFGQKLGDVQENSAEAWLPASAESTKANALAEEIFGTKGKIGLAIVYVRPGGLTAEDNAVIAANQELVAPQVVDGKTQVVPSEDGKAAMLTGQMSFEEAEATAFTKTIKELRKDVHATADPIGLQVYVTGDAGSSTDFFDAFAGLDGMLLGAAFLIVMVLLIITYRSPIIWFVPLLSAGLALGVANGIVYLLAKADVITVNGQSASILPIMAIGVGTDYALLLISRYREELHAYEDRHEAMAVALKRTMPAILASAATVSLAMLVLLLASLNSNKGLGPVLAIGVITVFISMVTFLPAILVCMGRWVFWPRVPRHDDVVEDEARHPKWSKVAAKVTGRARPMWIGTSVALAACAFGLLTLGVGQPQSEAFTKKTESISGFKALAEHFPAGAVQPVEVYTTPDKAEAVTAAVRGVANVQSVGEPQIVQGTALLRAILGVPGDSDAAEQAVDDIRAAAHGADAASLVGGGTAFTVDVDRAETRDRNLIIPVALLVILIILVVLLRAVWGPILLLGTVVLSFFAILGLASLIFNAIGYPDVGTGFFLSSFIFLVALGVDYTIFLMTRAREEVVELGNHVVGIRRAVTVTGGVITSAGLVLAGTFAVLGLLPIVFILQIGIAVALGVLLDTFVVRTLLVPALAVDAGRKFWWPSALAKEPDVPEAELPAPRAEAADTVRS